jgi:RNA polymerase sigma factor (TIGR02999 family)
MNEKSSSDPVQLSDQDQVTGLLRRWTEGDRGAASEAIERLHGELHRIASAHMRREGQALTLQPTALLNEAYLRLDKGPHPIWQNRNHFLGVAARIMRQVLVDQARHRRRAKRGGGWQRVTISEERLEAERPAEILGLDEALTRLESIDREKAEIVEVRYFAGMTVQEISQYIGVSTATVNRQLRHARAWLYRELTRT